MVLFSFHSVSLSCICAIDFPHPRPSYLIPCSLGFATSFCLSLPLAPWQLPLRILCYYFFSTLLMIPQTWLWPVLPSFLKFVPPWAYPHTRNSTSLGWQPLNVYTWSRPLPVSLRHTYPAPLVSTIHCLMDISHWTCLGWNSSFPNTSVPFQFYPYSENGTIIYPVTEASHWSIILASFSFILSLQSDKNELLKELNYIKFYFHQDFKTSNRTAFKFLVTTPEIYGSITYSHLGKWLQCSQVKS